MRRFAFGSSAVTREHPPVHGQCREDRERVVEDVERADVPRLALLQPFRHVLDDRRRALRAEARAGAQRAGGTRPSCGTRASPRCSVPASGSRRRRAERAPRRRRRRRTRPAGALVRDPGDERSRRGDRGRSDEQVERERRGRQALLGGLGTRWVRDRAQGSDGVCRSSRRRDAGHRLLKLRRSAARSIPRPGDTRTNPPIRVTLEAVRLPLAAEILAARAAVRLSRLTGRGGGTTVPGKAALEARSGGGRPARRAAPGRLRARLRDERQDDDGGDGGRDPAPRLRARA